MQIGAVDIGTGAWTALSQIAADALGVELDAIELQIGDTALPSASVCRRLVGHHVVGPGHRRRRAAFRHDHGDHPEVGVHTTAAAADANEEAEKYGCTRSVRISWRRGSAGSPGEVHVSAHAGGVLGGPGDQPDNAAFTADRRDDHGAVDGPA